MRNRDITKRLYSFNKLTHPLIAFVVLLAVADEDVVVVSFNYA